MCKILQTSVIYNRKKDSVFSLIISLFLAVTCIKASMQLMFAGEMLWNIVWSIIILATIAICFRYYGCILRKGSFLVCSVLFFWLGGTYLWSYLFMKPDQEFLLSSARILFFGCFPLLMLTSSIQNYEILYRKLFSMSVICVIVASAAMLYTFFFQKTSGYSMGVASSLTIPLLCIFSQYLRTRKVFLLPLLICGSLFILLWGSRGPLLCLIFYCFLVILIKVKWIYKLLFVFLFFNIALFKDFILRILNDFLIGILDQLDIQSRTLRFIFGETESAMDGSLMSRQEIFTTCRELILSHPFHGEGVFHSIIYPYIDAAGVYQNFDISVPYPHNLFLEILLVWGLVAGGLICIALFFYLWCPLSLKPGYKKDLWMIFLAGNLLLMFSGTLFNSFIFFILLGIICSKKGKRDENRIYS